MQISRLRFLILVVLCLGHCGQKVEGQRRERRRPVRRDTSECTILMEGVAGSRRQGPMIRASVVCAGETLFDETQPTDDVRETELPNGLKLFADTEFGGMAYVYIDREIRVDLANSSFSNLGTIGNNDMAAPLVIQDDSIDIEYSNFTNNDGNFLSGAVIAGGNSIVELDTVVFEDNVGEEGTVHVTDTANINIDFCTFRRNNGTEVGAIKMSRFSTGTIVEGLFQSDHGARMANEVYLTNEATLFLIGSFIDGEEAGTEFEEFLRDSERPDNDAEDFDLPLGGIVAVDRRSTINVIDCLLRGHVGQFGSIYAVGAPVFTVSRTDFINNRAIIGAGIYINADRTGFGRTLRCNFTENLARYGGALVFAGNGTYTLETCNFNNNQALDGGAIWGDYSENNACPRASSGSRVTINNCSFANNTARRNGGAFYVQCTDLFSQNSTFVDNSAMEGDGGMLFATNTFDVRFRNCSVDRNTASRHGGAVYLNSSNDFVMDNCTVVNNTAGSDGGTLVSLNGHGIMFDKTIFTDSTAGRHGGAIFASSVERVNFVETPLLRHRAGGRGGSFSGNDIGLFSLRRLTATLNEASRAGVVHINGGEEFDIAAVQIINNTATSFTSGAFELISVKNVTINRTTISSNTAGGSCGAIAISEGSHVIIQKVICELNSGEKDGGALCLNGADTATFKDVTLRSNDALSGTGGAVMASNVGIAVWNDSLAEFNIGHSAGFLHLENGTVFELNRLVIVNNQAAISTGGAIELINVDSIAIMGTNISQNRAEESCGAFSVNGAANFSLRDSHMRSNIGTSGGALCLMRSNTSVFNSTDFGYNEAKNGDGGAIEAVEGGSLSMTNTTFLLNRARRSGGAFSLASLRSAEIRNITVENGTSVVSGGCFVSHDVREISLLDSVFTNCTSETGGGAFFSGRSVVTKHETDFQHNVATEAGGAFHCSQLARLNIADSIYFYNNAPHGSMLDADCSCWINMSHSTVSRDIDRKNNGDFFRIKRECVELLSFQNEFRGAPHRNSSDLEWYEWFSIAIGILVILVVTLWLCCIRRRQKQATLRKAKNQDQQAESDDEEYEDTDEEYTEDEEYEESNDDLDGDEKEDKKRSAGSNDGESKNAEQ